jgi:hypothetical protein
VLKWEKTRHDEDVMKHISDYNKNNEGRDLLDVCITN